MIVHVEDVLELVKLHPNCPPIEISKLLDKDYDSLSRNERLNLHNKVSCQMAKLRKQGYIGHAEYPKHGEGAITLKGRTQSMRAWVKEYGLAESTVRTRIKRGWSLEDALTIPPHKVRGIE